MKPTFKRKRLWVDTAFQARLLVRIAFYFVAYVLVLLHVGFIFEALGHLTGGATRSLDELYLNYIGRQTSLLVTLLLVVPIMLYDMLKFSHRLAGPLFRCRKVMQEMAQGKAVPEFKARKHDLLVELFAAFNQLIHEWNRRVGGATGGHAAQPEAKSNGKSEPPASNGEHKPGVAEPVHV